VWKAEFFFKNALQTRGIWKRPRFVFRWTENILKAELFEDNDVTMIMWFPWPNFPQIQSMSRNQNYYISQLVHALWLVNLAGRILLIGPLEVEVKVLRDLSPGVLTFHSKWKFKTFLYSTNDLKKFKITRFAFEVRQPRKFEAFPIPRI